MCPPPPLLVIAGQSLTIDQLGHKLMLFEDEQDDDDDDVDVDVDDVETHYELVCHLCFLFYFSLFIPYANSTPQDIIRTNIRDYHRGSHVCVCVCPLTTTPTSDN